MFQVLAAAGGLLLTAALVLPSPTAAPSAAPKGGFAIDSVHSSILFSAVHFGASRFYGRFNEVGGEIQFDAAAPETASITIEIDATSVDSNDKKRDQHLSGPDFFSSKEFPTMTFTSTSVKVLSKASDDSPLRLEVTGTMEAGGKKQTEVIEVVQVGSGKGMGGVELVGFESHFTIKRSDYGMDYMLGGISDEVGMIISLEAGRR